MAFLYIIYHIGRATILAGAWYATEFFWGFWIYCSSFSVWTSSQHWQHKEVQHAPQELPSSSEEEQSVNSLFLVACEYHTVLPHHSVTIDCLKDPSPVATACKCAKSHTPSIACRVILLVAMFYAVVDSTRENTGTAARFQTWLL
jgi:hypothetical protein